VRPLRSRRSLSAPGSERVLCPRMGWSLRVRFNAKPLQKGSAGVSGFRFAERRKRSTSEPFDEKAVTESAVADYQRALSKPFHYRSDDACTRKDDLGALGLQPDD